MENVGGNGPDFWLLVIGLSSSFSGCLVSACCVLDTVLAFLLPPEASRQPLQLTPGGWSNFPGRVSLLL